MSNHKIWLMIIAIFIVATLAAIGRGKANYKMGAEIIEWFGSEGRITGTRSFTYTNYSDHPDHVTVYAVENSRGETTEVNGDYMGARVGERWIIEPCSYGYYHVQLSVKIEK